MLFIDPDPDRESQRLQANSYCGGDQPWRWAGEQSPARRLGVEAAFSMNLQNCYELDLATEKSGEKIKRKIQRRPPLSSSQTVASLL